METAEIDQIKKLIKRCRLRLAISDIRPKHGQDLLFMLIDLNELIDKLGEKTK